MLPSRKQYLLLFASLVWSGSLLLVSEGSAEENRFEEDIRAFEARDQENPPPKGAILFVGSSSIRLWDTEKWFPDHQVINRGFGGSHMSDVLQFVDRIVLPYEPRIIVLYEGDNDIASGKTPEQVRDDFVALADRIHTALPHATLYALSIKPSPSRWVYVDRMRRANALMAEVIGRADWMNYVDIDGPMLTAEGTPRRELFQEDGLHLNEAGYELWTSILRPFLGEPE